MIALPPVEAGAVKVTETVCDADRVEVTIVGAPAVVYGVTATESVDAALKPAAFEDCTMNVYPVPFVRPVNTSVVAAEPTFRNVEVAPVATPPMLLNTLTQ